MKNVKFWLAQIAMVAIVSMIFGSPAFAERPANGYQSDNASDAGKLHANENATGDTFDAETSGEDTSGEDTSGEDTSGGEETCVSTFTNPCP